MATNPKALASILTTITKAAGSVSAVFDATTKGVSMLDAAVTKASDEQKLRHRAQRRKFVHNLVRESSMEQAVADQQVVEFCSKSDSHKSLFEKSFDEFNELFSDELASKPNPSA